jgi:hypothetical protein
LHKQSRSMIENRDRVQAAVWFGDFAAVEAAILAGYPKTGIMFGGDTLLHSVVSEKKLRGLVPRMLALGWDPNGVDSEGCTPVHAACSEGDLETVQALVAAGGSLATVDCYGWTPVFYAYDCRPVLEWLATRPEVDWHWCQGTTHNTTMLDLVRSGGGRRGRDTTGCRAVVEGAMAAQRRWTPLRAAWCGCCNLWVSIR